jgi:hypothetical protein
MFWFVASESAVFIFPDIPFEMNLPSGNTITDLLSEPNVIIIEAEHF